MILQSYGVLLASLQLDLLKVTQHAEPVVLMDHHVADAQFRLGEQMGRLRL